MDTASIKHSNRTSQEVLYLYSEFLFPIDIREDFINNKFELLMSTTIHHQDDIIGLAIATPRGDGGVQLLSFFIIPSSRSKGLGLQLMSAVIDMAKGEGYNKIHANYKTLWPDTVAWEKILTQTNWKIIDTEIQYLLLDQLLQLKNELWIRSYKLPPNSHLISINSNKLNYLTNWISYSSWAADIPRDVRPNKAIQQTNADCSLLLLIDHDIAGWIIVHDLEDGIGQVSALYIRKKYSEKYKSLALKLIVEAFRRNQILTKAYFGYRKGNNYIGRMIQNRFHNYGSHYKKRRCLKTLQ